MTTQVNILQKLAACRARVAASLYVAMMATQVAAVSGAVAAEPAPEAPQTARQRAPYDLTGYWVAVVTTDWRMRMVVPGKGEYDGVPLNLAAKSFADAFDPAADEAAGTVCKAHGVGAVMRIPGRLHITWQDDNTLKVEMDAGRQTRLLRFAPKQADLAAPPTLQGLSIASWELPSSVGFLAVGGDPPTRGFLSDNIGAGIFAPPSPPGSAKQGYGSIRVQTSRALPGYLRKNGLPYGAEMSMTEYWDLRIAPDGSQWLAISAELDDPQYLQSPYAFAPTFKREPDGKKWRPSDCSLRW